MDYYFLLINLYFILPLPLALFVSISTKLSVHRIMKRNLQVFHILKREYAQRGILLVKF